MVRCQYQLPLIKLRIEASSRQQLFVRAALGDRAAVEHDDFVGVANGRNPVRDEQGRPPRHHAGQLRQDFFFRVGVHARERVVENQDARVADDGAGDGGALLLPARKRQTALADHGFEALRELAHVG